MERYVSSTMHNNNREQHFCHSKKDTPEYDSEYDSLDDYVPDTFKDECDPFSDYSEADERKDQTDYSSSPESDSRDIPSNPVTVQYFDKKYIFDEIAKAVTEFFDSEVYKTKFEPEFHKGIPKNFVFHQEYIILKIILKCVKKGPFCYLEVDSKSQYKFKQDLLDDMILSSYCLYCKYYSEKYLWTVDFIYCQELLDEDGHLVDKLVGKMKKMEREILYYLDYNLSHFLKEDIYELCEELTNLGLDRTSTNVNEVYKDVKIQLKKMRNPKKS